MFNTFKKVYDYIDLEDNNGMVATIAILWFSFIIIVSSPLWITPYLFHVLLKVINEKEK